LGDARLLTSPLRVQGASRMEPFPIAIRPRPLTSLVLAPLASVTTLRVASAPSSAGATLAGRNSTGGEGTVVFRP
jgi:hypothetical protein